MRIMLMIFLYILLPPVLGFGPDIIEKYYGIRLSFWVIPVLVLVSSVIFIYYYFRKEIALRDYFSCGKARARDWGIMLGRWLIFAAVLTIALYFKSPERLWAFPKRNPAFWGVVMICYPLLSVVAQGLIYRWYYEKAFASIFPAGLQLLIGAMLFSWSHIVFKNPYAIIFTFVGGLFFLSSYRKTRSMLFANIEHALYGNFIFTVGWGSYFFEH